MLLRDILELKVNCTGHMLHTNCLLKHIVVGIIEGMIDVIGRQRRCKLIVLGK
jgi:hypothetical protein